MIFYTIALFVICFAVLVEAVLLTLNVIGLFRANGVPFVPLSKKAIAEVISASNFQPNDLIVDLGCGDGRVLFAFEKAGAANLLGYEINHWPYILGKVKKHFKKSKVDLRFQNFFHAELGDVKIIVCYLLPKTLIALREKFDAELKPGSRIVSFGFEIKNWRTSEIIQTGKEKNAKQNVFVYQM